MNAYDNADAYGSATPRPDFMQRPEQGWLHDGRGLAAGKGVYFSFPVVYLGAIHMPRSLSTMHRSHQTDVTREAIALVCDACSGEGSDRILSEAAQSYKFGRVTVGRVQVKLSISASGMIIAPVAPEGSNIDPGIIAFHPMRLISLASGGEGEHYDFISYVSKDKDTDRRECHVFDTGVFSDEVLSTMGQAFILAQQLGQKQSSQPNSDSMYASLDEALRVPTGAESLYNDAADLMLDKEDDGTYLDIHAKPDKPEYAPSYMDVVPDPTDDQYMDVTAGLAKMRGAGEDPYDLADDTIQRQFVEQLNRNDAYLTTEAIKKVEMQRQKDQENDSYMLLAPDLDLKPTWDAYNVNEVQNKVPLQAVQEAQAKYMDIAPNPSTAGGKKPHYRDVCPDPIRN